eukprot:15461867-Alexandrium_andersonii.AAC.1
MPASSASPELRAIVLWVVGPMLDSAHARHAHSPARGPPGQETPNEVRVDLCAELAPSPCHGKW